MSETHPGKEEEKQAPTARERQLAGLRPIQKGEVRNPEGKNGRKRGEYIASWLDGVDPDDKESRKRIDIVLAAEYREAKAGDAVACKNLREAYGGKPKQQVDVTSDDEKLQVPSFEVRFVGVPATEPCEDVQPTETSTAESGER